jgi:hypothetical protein
MSSDSRQEEARQSRDISHLTLAQALEHEQNLIGGQAEYTQFASILNNPASAAQANRTVRATSIQGMQQLHGNRTVQRYVQHSPTTAPVSVQRNNDIAGLGPDDLRAVRERTGQASDVVGLGSGMVQGSDELMASRLFGLGNAERSAFGGVTGRLGGITGVLGMITGASTAMDSSQGTFDRVMGGMSAVGGLSGTLGWIAPGMFGAGGASGLAAPVGTSGAGAFATAGRAFGSAGAVLGAGLAGLTVGDLMTRGMETAENWMRASEGRGPAYEGHIGIGQAGEIGDYLMNGLSGRGGINSVGRAISNWFAPQPAARSQPVPQSAAPQTTAQSEQIPAWHPPMRPREDWEQMVSR